MRISEDGRNGSDALQTPKAICCRSQALSMALCRGETRLLLESVMRSENRRLSPTPVYKREPQARLLVMLLLLTNSNVHNAHRELLLLDVGSSLLLDHLEDLELKLQTSGTMSFFETLLCC